MKLAEVVLKDRIPTLGVTSFRDNNYDMTYEAGLVTIARREHADTTPWLIPMANVIFMKVAEAPKKAPK